MVSVRLLEHLVIRRHGVGADCCAIRAVANSFEALVKGGNNVHIGIWLVQVCNSGIYPPSPL